MKKRLDQYLVDVGLAISRERAKSLILQGLVLVNDVPVTKAGSQIDIESTVRLKKDDFPWVSRGALKLLAALDSFNISIDKKICLDVGSSTGGFTDVLLSRGAAEVFCIDVGTNQLAWKLRSDPRVHVFENTHIKEIGTIDLPKKFSVIVVDVSFISLKKVVPHFLPYLDQESDLITLVKPQFELSSSEVGKGGIVRESEMHEKVRKNIVQDMQALELYPIHNMESPIHGTKGNKEYLYAWKITNK